MKTGKVLLAPLTFLIVFPVAMFATLGLISVTSSALPMYADTRTIPDLPTFIAPLVNQADLIARAQVVQSTSRWNRDHSLIETEHRLMVHYTLLGKNSSELLILTDGGFLPAEDLGMVSSHSPNFSPGEEVLIFLQKIETGYRVVGSEAGKFSVINQEVVNDYYGQRRTLEQIIPQILTVATSQGRQTNLLLNWRSVEMVAAVRMINRPNQLVVDPKWPGAAPKIKVKVNLNSSRIGDQGGSAEQFLTAIQNALRTWSVVETAEFTLLYDGETTAESAGLNNKNEILFMHRGANSQVGQAQVWFTSSGTIVEADIWLNDDYQLDATGTLQASEIDLESAILHETGHWLPLEHTTNASDVMYPILGTGQRKIALNSDDIANVATLYPCPVVSCIDPAYANSSTPQPTATVITGTIPTDTPTPTLTPTLPSTAIPTATTTPTIVVAPTITVTPTLLPNAVTPTPGMELFLPFVRR